MYASLHRPSPFVVRPVAPMRRLVHIGCSAAAAGVLVLALACGTSAAAIHQRVVSPPHLNAQLAGYRIVGSPLTIRVKPRQYYYSVWLFVTTYPPSGIRTEKGEQVLLLWLGGD